VSQKNVEVVRSVRYPVSLPDQGAGGHRTLDERLFVRFPALYQRFAQAVIRLPPQSRARRLFLRRVSGRAAAAANRRDFDVLLVPFDRAIEYRPGGDWVLDLPDVSRGHSGYRQVWKQMLDAFENLRFEPQEVIDLGDRFLGISLVKGHGSSSGVPVTVTLFQLFTMRGGLVVQQDDFQDRTQAFEAAGLSEQDAHADS
jgi:ketosteroid isomerase-like protein